VDALVGCDGTAIAVPVSANQFFLPFPLLEPKRRTSMGYGSRILNAGRTHGRQENLGPRPTDPDEQEIVRLCEEIQADWSDDEREARRLWMPVDRTLVRPNRADLERFTVPRVRVG
jgi:hypothetical protein